MENVISEMENTNIAEMVSAKDTALVSAQESTVNVEDAQPTTAETENTSNEEVVSETDAALVSDQESAVNVEDAQPTTTETETENTSNAEVVSETENVPNVETATDSENPALSEYNALEPSTKRAIQNTLKIMDGLRGGGFYVKYIRDMGTCYSWLNLIIVYPDGSHKSIILYKNYLKEADIEDSNGVYTLPKKNGTKKGYTKVYWEGDERLDRFSSLEQYEIPQMPIPARGLWERIFRNKSKIPTVIIHQTATLDQLVTELREWAKGASNMENQGFMDDANRSYIDTDEFRRIVESNGWSVSRARAELDMQGLFEKDSNTKGYQKTKRVGATTRRFYVIRKESDIADTPPKSLEDTEYYVGKPQR